MTTDALPDAGPELDKLVAVALGWPAETHLSRYTGDAMAALEAWCKQHPDDGWNMAWYPGADGGAGSYWCSFYNHVTPIEAEAPTHAEAICQAIVLASREVYE